MQLELRQSERDALVRLLEYVQQPASDKGGLHSASNAVYALPKRSAADLTGGERHEVKKHFLQSSAPGVLA